jgi:hypothetical protein
MRTACGEVRMLLLMAPMATPRLVTRPLLPVLWSASGQATLRRRTSGLMRIANGAVSVPHAASRSARCRLPHHTSYKARTRDTCCPRSATAPLKTTHAVDPPPITLSRCGAAGALLTAGVAHL